jgi:SEFIR domain
MVRVFVSYSHDSEEHAERVLALADRLRREGVDARLDRYEPHPSEGWPRWSERQISDAEFVLLVCTPTYRRRFDREERPGVGGGVEWEGLLASLALYEAGGNNDKLIPVLFEEGTKEHVPLTLRPFTHHQLWKGYDDLYRRLTRQAKTPLPPLGPLRAMPASPRSGTRQPNAPQTPTAAHRRRSGAKPSHTAIVLDRTTAWSALTKFDAKDGHVAFVVYGTWQQDLLLFMDRIATYFKDPAHCSVLHHVVQVQPEQDHAHGGLAGAWETALLAATRARRAPLEAALAYEATDRPVLLLLRSIDGPLHGLGPEERAELVSFLAASLTDALTGEAKRRHPLRHPLRVVVPLEVGDGKDPLLKEIQRALNQRGSALELRAPIALTLPDWPEIEQHVVEEFARHELEPSEPALARCQALYDEVMASEPPPTFQALADPLHDLVVELVHAATQSRRR